MKETIEAVGAPFYVGTMRAIRAPLRAAGLLRYLEHRPGRRARFLRSLFSIWDARDLASLDLPWFTFDAIAEIESYLASLGRPAVAFEYGSGASTAWLARRCGEVASVEHDRRWEAKTAELCAGFDNVTLMTREPEPIPAGAESEYRSEKPGQTGLDFERYVKSIVGLGKTFDLISVDGRCRVQALKAASELLNDGGIIVFDNSDRRRYQAGIASTGMKVERYRGLTPGWVLPTETSILRW